MNPTSISIRRSAMQLLLLAGVIAAFCAPASAQQLLQGNATSGAEEGEKSRWRGSLLFYSNTVSAKTFDKGSDLTYNPYYSNDLVLLPRFYLNDTIFLRGILSISHEFTEPDDTTFSDETFVGDTTVGVGAPLWTIPVLDIGISGTFDLRLPTSKFSRGQDLLFALQANANFFRVFPVLSGLAVSYSFGAVRFFQSATTGSLESSPFGEDESDEASATSTFTSRGRPEMYLNNGVRNQKARVMHTAALSLDILPWLSTSASATFFHDWLYDNIEENPGATTAIDIGTRDFIFYSCEVAVQPLDFLGIALVANTFNPQLSPDPGQTYFTPFFNRFTQVSAQFRFNIGALL